jgi:hypothetical protein
VAPDSIAHNFRRERRIARHTMKNFRLAIALGIACVSFVSVPANTPAQNPGAKDTKSAMAADAPVLPHDTHDGLTIQADTYTDHARARQKFGGKADPLSVGVLPVEVTLRNATDKPIRVDINTIQLEVRLRNGGRQDLDWISAEDVAALIAHPAGAGAPSRPRVPGLPIPSGDKKADKLAEILKPLTLNADTIPPMGAVHGFVYFNVSNDIGLADDATLYIPDAVLLPSKKALMFFEVPLGKPAQK